jgi:hypothetical protein
MVGGEKSVTFVCHFHCCCDCQISVVITTPTFGQGAPDQYGADILFFDDNPISPEILTKFTSIRQYPTNIKLHN